MKNTVKNKPHSSRLAVVFSCLFAAVLITTTLLVGLNPASAQEAPGSEPNAPDVTARCDLAAADPNRWNCEDVEDPLFSLNRLTDHYLRYKSDGTPCVVYGGDGLYYACFNYNTNKWDGYNVPIDSSPLVGGYASLDFNSFNKPFISYYDAANGRLKLAYNLGNDKVLGDWTKEVIVDNTTTCTTGSVYGPESSELQVEEPSPPDSWLEALISGNFWMDRIIDPVKDALPGILAPQATEVDGIGRYTSIAIDPLNRIHISFSDWFESSLSYWFWDGGGTRACKHIDNWTDYNNYDYKWTSIDTSGSTNIKVHISYFYDKYDQLRYATNTGGSAFTITEIEDRRNPAIGDPGSGPYSSIAVDETVSPAAPYISYYRWTGDNPVTDGELWLAYKIDTGTNCSNAGAWTCQRLDNTTTNLGGFTSIAFDKDDGDTRRVSYYDFVNGNLRYNGNTLGSTTGNVGLHTSIDTYYNGNTGFEKRAVAYIDASEGELQVLEFDNFTDNWNLLGADGYVTKFGDTGLYTSLAVRQIDDIPFISYWNQTNTLLNYAYGTRIVQPPPPVAPLYFWESAPVTDILNDGTFSSIGIGGVDTPGESDGEPVIAYYSIEEADGGSSYDLMFAYRDKNTLNWVFDDPENPNFPDITIIDSSEDVGQFVDMAIGSTGIPHISYYNATDGNLNYAVWDIVNSEWDTQTLDLNGDVGLFSSIDLGPNDRPYIAYYDYTNTQIKYRYVTPIGSWANAAVVVTNVGFNTEPGSRRAELDIAYEDSGTDKVHIAYFDNISHTPGNPDADLGDLKFINGNVTAGTGAVTWGAPVTIDSGGSKGRYNSLAVEDSSGFRHICYYDQVNGFLKVAQWLGVSWSTFIVDDGIVNAGDTGLYCSTALESDGEVTVSYYDKTRGSLRFAHNPKPYAPTVLNLFIPLLNR